MLSWETVAKGKIFKDRLISWGVLVNFVLLLCTNRGVELTLFQLLFFGCVALLVAYVDMKYVLPKEQEYYFRRNPEWQRRNDRKL